jgi:hypothetical protein
MNSSQRARLAVARGLVYAGLLLQVAIIIKSMSPNELSPELSQRFLGFWMGVMVAYFGNSIPKERPSVECRNAAAGQGLRRFGAWSLTIGGLGFAVLSAFAPYETSTPLAVSFLGACTMLVVFRLVSAARGPGNPRPSGSPPGERS